MKTNTKKKKYDAYSCITIFFVILTIHLPLFLQQYSIYFIALLVHLSTIIPLYRWWEKHKGSCPKIEVIKSFGAGYILMTLTIYAISLLIIVPVNLVLAYVFPQISMLIPIELVGFEELIKVYWANKKKVEMKRETASHQIIYTSLSIGYATHNAFLLIFIFCFALNFNSSEIGIDEGQRIFFDLVITVGVLITILPVHVLSGYLIGLNRTKGFDFMRMGAESFIFRLLIHYSSISTLYSKYFYMGFLMNIAICIAMVYYIKRVEASLPEEYLKRVGHLGTFGYTRLLANDPQNIELV
mmetsp:Transcript_2961/g.4482  ORF Transcript_2961/g.4482 Transcript_2961/m.4482 type:complete len:298 (-) Transcript_2961:64-957(-)